MSSTIDYNIYEFGDNKINIKISILKVWHMSEQSLLYRYEPFFNHFLKWIAENNENEDFIKFLKYTKSHDDSIVFKQDEFKIDFDSGTIVNFNTKQVLEVDAILEFCGVVLYLKGMQFWICDRKNPKLQYYYEMH